MIDEKKLLLMKKLRELAERGVGGEREGARQKMEELMKKYNIEEADLSDDIEEDFEFKYSNDQEFKLLSQTFYKVIWKDYIHKAYRYTRGKGQKTIRGIRCTKQQGIQIAIEYEFYCQQWKKEQEFLLSAFIQKHNIFMMDEDKQINGEEEKEKMSRKEALRMLAAMEAMEDASIVQRIEG